MVVDLHSQFFHGSCETVLRIHKTQGFQVKQICLETLI